jgi:hypothetical protein
METKKKEKIFAATTIKTKFQPYSIGKFGPQMT